MSGPRHPRRLRPAALLLGSALAATSCSPAAYEGIPDRVDVPRLTEPPTTSASPTAAPTTAAPTTAAPTTAAPTTAAPTTAAPTTAVASNSRLVRIGTTGTRLEVPAGWRVEAAPDQRALLPVLVDLLRTEGLPPQPVFVALLPDTGSAVAPNVLAYELPRSPDSSAIGTLRTLRAAAGTRVLAGEPASEPSRLGDAAYVTYQWTANGASIISEHYAFVRPTAILLVTMTTTVERAQVDGRVFGRVLGSLAAES